MTDFKKLLEHTTEAAKTLQLTFPNPVDAVFALSMILAGMSKSTGVSLDTISELMKGMQEDMNEVEEKFKSLH